MSKFAEKFKKWANKSNLSDVDLIEKIRRITPDKILQVHARTDEAQWPTTWEAYLDWDLDIERRMKHMFTTSSSRKDPDAMQVDKVKNKGKGKGKVSTKGEVNATDKKTSVCKYCKKERKYGHRCEEYKKAMIKEGKWKEKEGGGGTKGSGPAMQRQKRYKTVVRRIEMQVTDDEEEEAESSRLAVARIREVVTDDEETDLEMLAHLEAKYPHLRSTSSEPDMLQANKPATSRLSSFWQGAL
ncbi:uncharacterized protein LAESUDRAFT_762664 [Laetiporus sulphureus 93-53]|uniref:Uncharacterized protein n=1 Tax=Laetiporus sulphureus 93-53 TaxID=1314785 RepID=A0A165CBV4_9APHY|nr:uncharacterized protein LAESUDRAFT_762664 [Laetiporus sulphureus 93-53]KZT02530.1 hypothetical protein LAESUDRAFT_762664 [Laetiporus sulphureus 93-53]